MFSGILAGTKVLVGDDTGRSFLKEKGFGEDIESRAELSLVEALFLLDKGKMRVVKSDKELSPEELIDMGSKHEKTFYDKFVVFRDLRDRGLLVRTGFKFGTDFRVYERGKTVKSSHSTMLVHVVPEEYKCSFPELARAIRVANTVNKRMIFAIVDEESKVTYYSIDRMNM